jgi:hypothetical protein
MASSLSTHLSWHTYSSFFNLTKLLGILTLRLCNSLSRSHVTAGIKINDPRAKDPISGIPIGFEDSTKVQSRELCFPCKILIAKDTKELYSKYFEDFFGFFKQVETAGFGEFQRPFLVSSPQDLSSLWKCYDKGGACKLKKEFCHLCTCQSDVCHKPCQGSTLRTLRLRRKAKVLSLGSR